MSMICSVLGVSPSQIAALKANPALASYLANHMDQVQFGGSTPPGVLTALGPVEKTLDLHKSWHLLHYLFTGEAEPAESPGGVLLSGEELGEDLGYGPPRLHDAEATRAFAEFLKGLSSEKLEARLNLEEMQRAGVYAIPMGPRVSKRDQDDLRAEITTYFEPLRDYVLKVTAKNSGLLIWLS
jgi:hypothetical protein